MQNRQASNASSVSPGGAHEAPFTFLATGDMLLVSREERVT